MPPCAARSSRPAFSSADTSPWTPCTSRPTRRAASRIEMGPAPQSALEQFPALGGEHSPEQLGRGESDPGRFFGQARLPDSDALGHRIGRGAHVKNDGFHGSASLWSLSEFYLGLNTLSHHALSMSRHRLGGISSWLFSRFFEFLLIRNSLPIMRLGGRAGFRAEKIVARSAQTEPEGALRFPRRRKALQLNCQGPGGRRSGIFQWGCWEEIASPRLSSSLRIRHPLLHPLQRMRSPCSPPSPDPI
jgi:hypothetical protein